MDSSAFEVARARALTLCRDAAADPIPVEEALSHLRELSAAAPDKEAQEEIQALELVLQAVGNLQALGDILAPPVPAAVFVPKIEVGAVVVPAPRNVR